MTTKEKTTAEDYAEFVEYVKASCKLRDVDCNGWALFGADEFGEVFGREQLRPIYPSQILLGTTKKYGDTHVAQARELLEMVSTGRTEDYYKATLILARSSVGTWWRPERDGIARIPNVLALMNKCILLGTRGLD